MKTRLVILVSLGAGGGDLATGILLLGNPAWTLGMLGVSIPSELVWMQYIGVFVACVGLSYGFGLRPYIRSGAACALRTVWEITALFRAAICVFVCASVWRSRLEPAWLTVAAVDGFWALLQGALLTRGVLGRV